MMSRDVLQPLEPYYAEGVTGTETDKITALHEIFYKDFISDGVYVDGIQVKIKPYKYSRSSIDGLPINYETYLEKFVHIITRTEAKTNWKTSPQVRAFDPSRANRVHWIKPILENCSDRRITRFEYIEANGSVREYFWYRQKQYMVVLEHINPNFDLITGFCVDADNQEYYQNKYINRIKY